MYDVKGFEVGGGITGWNGFASHNETTSVYLESPLSRVMRVGYIGKTFLCDRPALFLLSTIGQMLFMRSVALE